jgi:hypothetical protein
MRDRGLRKGRRRRRRMRESGKCFSLFIYSLEAFFLPT